MTFAATHECPAEGCADHVPHDRLMCLKHWRMVPKPQQDAVWKTWRRVSRDPHAYRDAREEAVRAVNAKLAGGAAGGAQGSLL
jgi:hypothetical protein